MEGDAASSPPSDTTESKTSREEKEQDQARSKRPNAFTELMAPKPKHPKPAYSASSGRNYASKLANAFKNRDGLKEYTLAPETYSAERVVYHTPSFVIINDLYPKATVHLLILPRDAEKMDQHPFDALSDLEFLTQLNAEVQKCKEIAAAELKRKYGSLSASSQAYNDALDKALASEELEAEDEELDLSKLPQPRNWSLDISAGIHAHPSMNHLHVHVLSTDMHSPCMKHRKHYNSFKTPFFVPIEDFPLAEDDVRRHPGREGYLASDLKCWRCGRNFGNRFAQLRSHLEAEWDAWRRE